MHIPDGYLGPQTYLPAFAVMAALWTAGVARVKRTLRRRQVPMLALGAAFCFVIMLFNVPIPGGSTGHAVGAVLVAILFGPWAAMIAVSLALIVQALIFGDGGITAIGANCLNMAVICPFVGWGVYRLIAGFAPVQSARHWIGGAVGGYLGLGVASIAAGVEFGLQPLLAHDAAGRALYFPFGLQIAVPAMAAGHFLAFSFVEAIATGLVVAYLQRTAPEMIVPAATGTTGHKALALLPRIAVVLGVLVLLSPLGLIIPAHFHAGSAWGEWSSDEIREQIAKITTDHQGYVPMAIQYAEDHSWKAKKAPMPDYALRGQENAKLPVLSRSYLLAGAIGVMVIGFLLLLLVRFLARKDDADAATGVDERTQQHV